LTDWADWPLNTWSKADEFLLDLRLDAARYTDPPFVASADWMRLPLTHNPDFATWQPFLDEIIAHPTPDAFRAQHNFRAQSKFPGFTSPPGSTSFRPAC
jgi:hypothetical protein